MTNSEYLQLQLVSDESKTVAAPATTKLLDASVPTDAHQEFEKGAVLVASGDKRKMEQAIRHLERAVASYPKFLEAKLMLGAIHMDLMRWGEAGKVLSQANENHPATPNVLFALGELYLRLRKYSEAEKILREGLGIEPRLWQGRFTLGRVYWANNDLVQAGRQVGIALQLNPDLAEAHLLAGNYLLARQKNRGSPFRI